MTPQCRLKVVREVSSPIPHTGVDNNKCKEKVIQEGLAVASIARDDPSTLPGDDPFPRARMHRDRNAW